MQLPNLFKKETLEINPIPETIAECLGLSTSEFDVITNEICFALKENRVDSFKNYLESQTFKKHKLDLTKPNDCFILGYAFCAAIMLDVQKENFNHIKTHLEELHKHIGGSQPIMNGRKVDIN